MASITSIALLFFSLVIQACVAANPNETFLTCFLNQTRSPNPSQLIYNANTNSYTTILGSSVQNQRFLISSSTKKPSYIVKPSTNADVQAAVICGKKYNIRVRVRSGGHDYEGLSYASSGSPFVLLDLANFQSVTVNANDGTAWAGAGATVGQVYYYVGTKSSSLGFPAGICLTVGIGGQYSGGGLGTLTRKYGLAADNIVDAVIVNANGDVLNRATMGEDLFWAIRGGGASSFGVLLSYKLKLVSVPPRVTVFAPSRTLSQNATQLVEKWQQIGSRLEDNLFIRTIAQAFNDGNGRNIQAIFQGMYLGRTNELLASIKMSFPELGLQAQDCTEMSWLQSVLYFAGYNPNQNPTVLLDRKPQYSSSFKGKSDFVQRPISVQGLQSIWKLLMDARDQPLTLILDPLGGVMDRIADNAIAFPHRKGNLYDIQYFMRWSETDEAVTKKHLDWIRGFYSAMAPYVSANPRGAYLNYRDLDLGSNVEGNTSYAEASVWGQKYFRNNFVRLARVKSRVDPSNYFWNEQSIPPFS